MYEPLLEMKALDSDGGEKPSSIRLGIRDKEHATIVVSEGWQVAGVRLSWLQAGMLRDKLDGMLVRHAEEELTAN